MSQLSGCVSMCLLALASRTRSSTACEIATSDVWALGHAAQESADSHGGQYPDSLATLQAAAAATVDDRARMNSLSDAATRSIRLIACIRVVSIATRVVRAVAVGMATIGIGFVCGLSYAQAQLPCNQWLWAGSKRWVVASSVNHLGSPVARGPLSASATTGASVDLPSTLELVLPADRVDQGFPVIDISVGSLPLFMNIDTDWSGVQEQCEGLRWIGNATETDGSLWSRFVPMRNQNFALNNVSTGQRIAVRVYGRMDCILARLSLDGLRGGERRRLEVVMPPRGREMTGIVANEGRPIPKATIALEGRGRDSSGEEFVGTTIALTDDQGRYRIADLYASQVNVTVSAKGFVSQLTKDLALVRNANRDIEMARGLCVQVKVVDDSGNPTDVQGLRATFEGGVGMERAVAVGPGQYELCQLPRGDVSLWIDVSGVQLVQRHNSATPTAVFVVPPCGEVHVRWDFGKVMEANACVYLRRPGDERTPIAFRRTEDRVGVCTFGTLLPGAYEVGVVSCEGGQEGRKVLIGYKPVTVVAHRKTFAHLSR